MSNGAYGERAAAIARVLGVSHSCWDVPWTESPSPEEFSARLAGPGGPFTHAFWVHHETTTGMLNPLDAFAEACRSRGVVPIVDAMSSFAGMPLPLGRLPIGYLITSSNKCLQGMAGIGIVFSRLDALGASRGSARSVALDLHAHEAGERSGQFPFTPPVQVAYALLQAVRETLEETVAGRAARYRSCYESMLAGMERLGFEALLPPALRSGLLTAFRTPARPGFGYGALHDHLLGLGVTLYPGKLPGTDTFRVANIGDITTADIRTFLTGVETYTNAL
jgi:2-aminoethylphosphonate-pyruvate transaminase